MKSDTSATLFEVPDLGSRADARYPAPAVLNVRRVRERASEGHALGQVIGDWSEEYVAQPMLRAVAERLGLFLDTRFVARSCRGAAVSWPDDAGNVVDYDFVLELGGTPNDRGIPVGFVESFWRRGARHSKDKARDDTGKLVPMRDTYPTARFLAIVAAGDFTDPARELVRSRGVELFYIPKTRIVESFAHHGLVIDYPDRTSEDDKSTLVRSFEAQYNTNVAQQAAATLRRLVGEASVTSFIAKVVAALAALPQEIRIVRSGHSRPVVFDDLRAAGDFLRAPTFDSTVEVTTFQYAVVYSDGTEFQRELDGLDEMRALHKQLTTLADHVAKIPLLDRAQLQP